MANPWKDISLSDYENHMKLNEVKQLQSLNNTTKNQLNEYPVNTVMIMGIAGGNGLEHICQDKYNKVYGIDINEKYLETTSKRFKNISNILECLNIDIINEAEKLPKAELVIANLLIEYVGYKAFTAALKKVSPRYVSCVIQVNENNIEWVSSSPYIHAFDNLDNIHFYIDEKSLTDTMCQAGYKFIKKEIDILPNRKSLVRLDYENSKE